MARITLVPQRKEFFHLYNQASANAVAIARALVDLLAQAPNGSQQRIRDIKELEHEGPRLVVPGDAVVVEHLRALEFRTVREAGRGRSTERLENWAFLGHPQAR